MEEGEESYSASMSLSNDDGINVSNKRSIRHALEIITKTQAYLGVLLFYIMHIMQISSWRP